MQEQLEKEKKVVMVYMEQTPNPEALKFVTNLLLLPEGSVEYGDKSSAFNCPLAYQLFDFTGVRNVFITSNFVTVTKASDIDWFEIQNIIREFIRGFLVAGDAVFLKSEVGSRKSEVGNEASSMGHTAPIAIGRSRSGQTTNQLEEQIKQLLDEYVKPAVEQDGGAIDFKSFDEGVVTLILKGSCSGCPSSTLTLKSGIERLLMQMMPEVTEVIAE
ncbi:MAG: NifU family protein [Bacteroidia bacterium]